MCGIISHCLKTNSQRNHEEYVSLDIFGATTVLVDVSCDSSFFAGVGRQVSELEILCYCW
jgi:hypothetical protein